MASTSSIKDPLRSLPLDSAVWMEDLNPWDPLWLDTSVVGTAARLRLSNYSYAPGNVIYTADAYDFDSVQVRLEDMSTINGTSRSIAFSVWQSGPSPYGYPYGYPGGRMMAIDIIDAADQRLRLTWEGYDETWFSPTTPDGTPADYYLPYDGTEMRYLRMTNAVMSGRVYATFDTSPDGRTWTTVYEFNAAEDTSGRQYRVSLSGYHARLYIADFNAYGMAFRDTSAVSDGAPLFAVVPLTPDPTTQTPRAPRTLNPSATVPAASATCATLLDLIREFSATVRGAVRILNGYTIEMVDPNEPLPDGWDAGSGDEYYSQATQTVQATTDTLRLSKGWMDLTVTADIVANDVGIITGGFRIPARLPAPNLDPAPVSRVSYTFTPDSFRASVELTYPDTPLIVRER